MGFQKPSAPARELLMAMRFKITGSALTPLALGALIITGWKNVTRRLIGSKRSSSSPRRLRVYECDVHFIYAADGGRQLLLNEADKELREVSRWSENCRMEHDRSFQSHVYSDPMYTFVRRPPIVLQIESRLNRLRLGRSLRHDVPLLTSVTIHDTGFLSIRQSLSLTNVNLDALDVARVEMLNEGHLDIKCPVLGPLSVSLDEYSWKLFEDLQDVLGLNPRVPIERPGELERVLVLRRLSGDPTAEDLITKYALDMAPMVARLQWYEDQSYQFAREMVDDALILHRHLMVLCKWQSKVIYYSHRLPEHVRAWWRDEDIVNVVELLMVQFFAARMYNVFLEQGRSEAQNELDAVAASEGQLQDADARSRAFSSLLHIEAVRAEVELAMHETQNSVVSLSYMIRQVIERYDRAVGLTDRFELVRSKLDGLERLKDVIDRTLARQTNEALLEADLKIQQAISRQTTILIILTVFLLALTILTVSDLRDLASQIIGDAVDLADYVVTRVTRGLVTGWELIQQLVTW